MNGGDTKMKTRNLNMNMDGVALKSEYFIFVGVQDFNLMLEIDGSEHSLLSCNSRIHQEIEISSAPLTVLISNVV